MQRHQITQRQPQLLFDIKQENVNFIIFLVKILSDMKFIKIIAYQLNVASLFTYPSIFYLIPLFKNHIKVLLPSFYLRLFIFFKSFLLLLLFAGFSQIKCTFYFSIQKYNIRYFYFIKIKKAFF